MAMRSIWGNCAAMTAGITLASGGGIDDGNRRLSAKHDSPARRVTRQAHNNLGHGAEGQGPDRTGGNGRLSRCAADSTPTMPKPTTILPSPWQKPGNSMRRWRPTDAPCGSSRDTQLPSTTWACAWRTRGSSNQALAVYQNSGHATAARLHADASTQPGRYLH